MKYTAYFITLGCLVTQPILAQGINYKFRVRYADYTPYKSSGFIISGQRLSTDPQGVISFKCSEELSYVNIESSDLKQYEIMYPLEGKAILPKDPGTFIDIYIKKPAGDPVKQIRAEIASTQASMQNKIIKKLEDESRKGYDKIVELLNNKDIDESALAEGRMEFFPLISSALNNYVNESRNFNDAFLSLSGSLTNKGAYEQLNGSIYAYNEIFNLLNANKDIYQQAIATYWNSKELSLKFSNLIDFAIEDLHRPFILEVNYTFINRFYDLNKETNKNKKKASLEYLKKDMEIFSSSMERRLVSLGERVTNMNSLLANNKAINN